MKAVVEFVGTFLFLLVIALVAPMNYVLTPIVIGLALTTVVYALGHVSGAHFNPAVTIALLSQRKISFNDALAYIVAQIAGGVLAFATANYLISKPTKVVPADNIDVTKAVIVEIIFTFLLVTVVLSTAVSRKTAGNSYFGLAIGLAIVTAAAAGGPISGGSFNPAVSIASGVTASVLPQVWVGIVGPIVGGLLAAFLWNAMDEKEVPVV